MTSLAYAVTMRFFLCLTVLELQVVLVLMLAIVAIVVLDELFGVSSPGRQAPVRHEHGDAARPHHCSGISKLSLPGTSSSISTAVGMARGDALKNTGDEKADVFAALAKSRWLDGEPGDSSE